MNIVNIYRGKRGVTGNNGRDGILASDIRQSLVTQPLLDLFYNNKQSKVSSNSVSNRIGEALIEDRYGDYSWTSSDDRTNYITYNNDFSQWGDPQSKWSIVGATTDPDGGSNATAIDIDSEITESDFFGIEAPAISGIDTGKFYTFSVWIRVITGSVSKLNFSTPTLYRIDAELAGWQRVKISLAPNFSGGFLNLMPVCAAGTRIALYKAQFENGSTATGEIDTTGVTVTEPNLNASIRSNQNGYLFEGEATNLVKNNENLSAAGWSIVNGIIEEYPDLNMFGQRYDKILVNNNGFTTTTLTIQTSAAEGETYHFSAFCRVYGGSVTAVTFGIGEGEKGAISNIGVSSMERYATEAVAGTGGLLTIQVTSTDGNGLLALSGIQMETIEISSYIRNGNAENTRLTDANIADYTIRRGDQPWSFQFSDIIEQTDTKKYVFHNTLTGGDEFSAYMQNGNIYITNGPEMIESLGIADSSSIGATFDGVNLNVYKDGYLINSGVFTSPSTATPSQLYIGTDQNFENSIDGYLSLLSFWGDALTATEMRFAGVTND